MFREHIVEPFVTVYTTVGTGQRDNESAIHRPTLIHLGMAA